MSTTVGCERVRQRRRRLSTDEQTYEQLQKLAASCSAQYRLVIRARIVVMALDGYYDALIARHVGVSERTVYEWTERFRKQPQMVTLDDRPRSGRRPVIDVQARCEVIRLACERPKAPANAPRARFRKVWTYDALHEAVVAKGMPMSRSEVYRTLHDRQIRPARIQMWLNSQDPEFKEKAKQICELYRNPPEDAVVVCVDEKTGMQALERVAPDRHASPGRNRRHEYEYKRHGTSTLLAAFDTRTGKVFGYCNPTRTAEDILQFMHELARALPNKQLYIVWDNLNIHHGPRWQQFNEEHGNRLHFVHTPVHASWLNQIEIWFGIVHRRVLKYGSFKSVQELEEEVTAFIEHWNDFEAHPFKWKFRGFRVKTDLRQAA